MAFFGLHLFYIVFDTLQVVFFHTLQFIQFWPTMQYFIFYCFGLRIVLKAQIQFLSILLFKRKSCLNLERASINLIWNVWSFKLFDFDFSFRETNEASIEASVFTNFRLFP